MNMEQREPEIWKDIDWIEGLNGYQVSNMGRVRSLDRIVTHKNGKKYNRKGKVLKLQYDYKGYVAVDLGKKLKAKKVHQLVAMAFCDGYEDGLEVGHKDNVKDNNTASNLEWVTHSQNCKDAYATGIKKPSKSCSTPPRHAKLNEKEVRQIKTLLKFNVDWDYISERFGVSISTIDKIKYGITWCHVKLEES